MSDTSNSQADLTRLLALTPEQTAAAIGVSRATLFRMHATGQIPRPVKLSERIVRWPVDELRAWLAAGSPRRDLWEPEWARSRQTAGRGL